VSNRWLRGIVVASCAALLLVSCAHQPPRRRVGVNIDRRPTPAQPDSSRASARHPRPSTLTPRTVRDLDAAIASDTTAARNALTRCGGRTLRADQEGVFDSTTQLLIQVRSALAAGDSRQARSLAREAKQLAVSLGCR